MPLLQPVTDIFPWITLGIALLIGVLVGAEREKSRLDVGVGLRDIVLVSAIGWISGKADEPLLSLALLLGLVAVLVIQRPKNVPNLGVTTEFATIAVFAVCFVLGWTNDAAMVVLMSALAIALTLLLDAKAMVKRLFSEIITAHEFADTVRFLAIIFIIMPLLPEGRFGPYDFFAPRTVWVAVILVSGVSYVGYFLEKFLGGKTGTWLMAVLGGMVSTTVMTQTFARRSKEDPSNVRNAWQAATLANSIQFPRLLVLLTIAAPHLAQGLSVALLSAFAAGVGMFLLIGHGAKQHEPKATELKNPLRLWPALQFALFMVGVSLVGSVLFDLFGTTGMYITSSIGALLDVDAIALDAADKISAGILNIETGRLVLLIAIGSNIVVKSALAAMAGTRAFLVRMLLSFLVMFLAAAVGFIFLA